MLPVFNIMGKPKLIKDLGTMFPKLSSKERKHYAIFECPYCKKHFETQIRSVEDGHTKSCGCSTKIMMGDNSRTHGLSQTRLHKIYTLMIQRCYNKNNTGYVIYGDRGIAVCEEWRNSLVCFYEWAINNGYSKKLQIDRINNDGPYSPENCRWTSRSVNCQNSRLIRSVNTSGYRGVTKYKDGGWIARIGLKRIRYYLGCFSTPKQAAQAYNDFIITNKTYHPLNIINDEH